MGLQDPMEMMAQPSSQAIRLLLSYGIRGRKAPKARKPLGQGSSRFELTHTTVGQCAWRQLFLPEPRRKTLLYHNRRYCFWVEREEGLLP